MVVGYTLEKGDLIVNKGKLGCLSTCEWGAFNAITINPSMNVKIMNDFMGILQHNEQKATTRVKTKVVVEWDQLRQIAK
jgi:hypothetical protein